jgi:hypothetical protein
MILRHLIYTRRKREEINTSQHNALKPADFAVERAPLVDEFADSDVRLRGGSVV